MWKRKKIEKVKEFKYLEYMLQTNGEQEAHIKDRIKKAAAIIKQVWGIGKKRFGANWERKL